MTDSTQDKVETLVELSAALNITSVLVRAATPSDTSAADEKWKRESNQYRVTLKYPHLGTEYSFDWWQGVGIKTKPDAADCLENLLCDVSGETFADWCGNFGYDTDSRRALDTYLATQEQTAHVRRLLGSDFNRFMSSDR